MWPVSDERMRYVRSVLGEARSVVSSPQWLHLRDRAKTILNSLLHLLQAFSFASGPGGGPLSKGMPLMLAIPPGAVVVVEERGSKASPVNSKPGQWMHGGFDVSVELTGTASRRIGVHLSASRASNGRQMSASTTEHLPAIRVSSQTSARFGRCLIRI